jgi:NAD+ synthase (glutamine-hydrolysing)
VYDRLITGIREFFKNANATKAIVGLSGGIDSALVATLITDALGNESVHGILMPSPFSTLHSVSDALDLVSNLGISHNIVPIEGIYNKYIKEFNLIFDNHLKDITSENIQARIRANILMGYSNNTGALLMNTSNKSEIAMGYGTMYGDLCGALMVIGDLYKSEVYSLSKYINREKIIIPESTIIKEPSAELKLDQKDSDTLPEYSVLDPILHMIIEMGKNRDQLIEIFKDSDLIDRVYDLMNRSSFKSHQLPPMLQIGENPILPPYKCIKV